MQDILNSKKPELTFGLFISAEKAEYMYMPDQYRVQRWSGERTPDAGELRRKLIEEGYNVYLWTDQPGAVYGQHEHGEDQSHWVISGSIELIVEGFGTVLLSTGDRDFMPAGTFHSARVVGDEPVSYLIGEK